MKVARPRWAVARRLFGEMSVKALRPDVASVGVLASSFVRCRRWWEAWAGRLAGHGSFGSRYEVFLHRG